MYYFIINPKSKSGKGLAVWNTVKQELDKRKIEYRYYVTRRKSHATKFTKEICSNNEGINYIVAVGGDGTVNEIINGINDYSKVILGYIPTGSGNDLAKGLKIPSDPIETLNSILNSTRYIHVDHGEMTFKDSDTVSRRFCTSTGIGLDASICIKGLNSKAKYFLNKIGLSRIIYALITLEKIVSLKLVNATLIVDGKEQRYEEVAFITSLIQKSEGGGLLMAPNAKYNDRKLSVFMIHSMSKLKLLCCLSLLFLGKKPKIKGVTSFDCTSIEIFTDSKLMVHVDGKLAGSSNHILNTCYKDQIRMPK